MKTSVLGLEIGQICNAIRELHGDKATTKRLTELIPKILNFAKANDTKTEILFMAICYLWYCREQESLDQSLKDLLSALGFGVVTFMDEEEGGPVQ